MKSLIRMTKLFYGAFLSFLAADGWAIASHIALSTLMALFPFLIVVTALAGFIGSRELADQAAQLLLDTWPAEVSEPIAREIHNVMTTTRGGVLTIGVVLAIYFASNGVEALRVALNRAYGQQEKRHWLLLRLESVAYVLVAATASLVLAFLIVLGPLAYEAVVYYAPLLAPLKTSITVARYGIAIVALVVALVIVHKWLPAGQRRLIDILPGLAVTIVVSIVAGSIFGEYLARFAGNYATTYAGLASVMIALVFLYFTATIFIYGGELNAQILKRKTGAAKQPSTPNRAGLP